MKRLLNLDRVFNAGGAAVAFTWLRLKKILFGILTIGLLGGLWQWKLEDYLESVKKEKELVEIVLLEPVIRNFDNHWKIFEKAFWDVFVGLDEDRGTKEIEFDQVKIRVEDLKRPPDAKDHPAEYLQNLERRRSRAVLAIGPITSSGAKLLMPISKKQRVPQVLPAATAAELFEEDSEPAWVFKMAAKDETQAERLRELLRENCLSDEELEAAQPAENAICNKTVGIIRQPQNPVYSASIAENLTEELAGCGELCPQVVFDADWSLDGRTAIVFCELLPEFVVITGKHPGVAFLRRQLRRVDPNYSPEFLFTDAGLANSAADDLEENWRGVFLHAGLEPDFARLGTDAAHLALAAIVQAKKGMPKPRWFRRPWCSFRRCIPFTGAEVQAALENLKEEGMREENVPFLKNRYDFEQGINKPARYHTWTVKKDDDGQLRWVADQPAS